MIISDLDPFRSLRIRNRILPVRSLRILICKKFWIRICNTIINPLLGAGKGAVKILVAGLGWAMAELVLTRLVFLWVGARGVEFDWRYIQAYSSPLKKGLY